MLNRSVRLGVLRVIEARSLPFLHLGSNFLMHRPFDKVAGLKTGGVGGAWMCSRAVIESYMVLLDRRTEPRKWKQEAVGSSVEHSGRRAWASA